MFAGYFSSSGGFSILLDWWGTTALWTLTLLTLYIKLKSSQEKPVCVTFWSIFQMQSPVMWYLYDRHIPLIPSMPKTWLPTWRARMSTCRRIWRSLWRRWRRWRMSTTRWRSRSSRRIASWISWEKIEIMPSFRCFNHIYEMNNARPRSDWSIKCSSHMKYRFS